MTRNAFLVLFPLKALLKKFFFSQYLPEIKLLLKTSLAIFHGFFSVCLNKTVLLLF